MLLQIAILIAGLLLILFGANYLVDGSSSIARRFGLSEFVIGLTIVGIGTSTPEMVVSFLSAFKGSDTSRQGGREVSFREKVKYDSKGRRTVQVMSQRQT